MTLLNTNLMAFIIYLAFFSQILTISIFYASKWYKRKHFLLTEYPPTDYPNLYAQTSVVEFNRIKIRQLMDRSIAAISLSIMFVFYFAKVDLKIIAFSVLVLAVIQLIPWALSSYWNKENNLLMAQNFPSSKRKSSFNNRKITDFVTPTKLLFTLLTYVATLIFALYIFLGELWGDNSNKALLLLLLNTLMAAYLAWLLFNSLYGKKSDNFINSNDRLKLIAAKCNALTSFLILYSIFITGICFIRTFDLNQIYVCAMTGVFIQLMFVLSFSKTVNKNYDVYK